MTGMDIGGLLRRTLFEPQTAAAELIALRLPSAVLWQALALMSVLNAMVYALGLILSPPVPGGGTNGDTGFEGEALPMLVAPDPLLFAVALFVTLALSVLALHRVGRRLGGTSGFEALLVLLSWMQVLRLGVQVVVLVLGVLAPGLASIAMLVAAGWGLYILTGFVQTAHGFDNGLKALGVVILAMLAVAVGLSFAVSVLIVMVTGGS